MNKTRDKPMYHDRIKTTMVDDKQCTYNISAYQTLLFDEQKKIRTEITSRLSSFYLEVDEK